MSTDMTGDAAGVDDFAHLHLHTQYSLLDGAIRMNDLCGKVKERGMKSVAMTDHGNMFGAVQFYQQAKAHGVKPIFGCEAYIADGDAPAKTDRKNYHIVLLAKNEVGYQNLQRLVSYGHLEGFYYNPRIDRKTLREHSEGLVGLSACLGGHISRMITGGDMDGARERIREYADIFEPGSYFLELQPNGMELQEKVNADLAQLGRDLDVPIVATNDCHYVNQSEAYAHEVLMCMGMGRTINDEKRLKHDCEEFFIKTPQQMWGYFERYPEAMHNAARIARMCNVELSLGKPELPDFKLPEGTDEVEYLRKVAREGLDQRIRELRALGKAPDTDVYFERLERELGIIINMKFPGYFLIVWDFIKEAKKMGVPVGPGRGSGAGSLVAYSMRITDIDPMQYDLLFERFLNPERVSMPDFDIDFCMDRREEVIQYVTDHYGKKRVGQIATFHSLKARGLLRDVCRVMEKLPAEANELAKMVPEGPKVSLSLCMADPKAIRAKMKKEPEKAGKLEGKLQIAEAATKLRLRCEADPGVKQIVDIGCSLEGLNRHAGMHAAGIVIGNRELTEHVPCFKADDKIVTQYTMNDVEQAGLVKFDFLGLKTLTVIKHAVDQINGLEGPWRLDPTQQGTADKPFDIDTIPMDDAEVYAMISRGETTGVFQLESTGFKKLLQKLKPDVFEDIIAAVALYRPGPLEGGMVDQFIECKHGRRKIEYPHELLADVLRETYGVFVYQEQVMLAAQILAGFSLGGADLMRRAMGKKKVKEMERQRALFVEGCESVNNIDAKKANEIFDLIDKFAGYGFNKSHSAAYGLITYQTAYLKHHYPEAFMCGLMTCDKDKSENVVKFIAEARSMDITVLPPDVNESASDFNVVVRDRPELSEEELKKKKQLARKSKKVRRRQAREDSRPEGKLLAIRFGMGAVRNVGGNAVDSILAAREEEGPFKNIFELCRRVDLKRVNKRTLEGLVHSGAFDSVSEGQHRAGVVAAIESAVEQGQSSQRDRESGQGGLFDAFSSDQVYVEEYPKVREWAPKQRLLNERDALGFYLTGHPLDRYQQDIDRHASVRIGELRKELAGQEVVLGGVITEMRQVTTKAGKTMGFFQLEDQFGRVEVIVFPRTWATPIDPDEESAPSWGDWLMAHGEDPVFVTGKLEVEQNDMGEVSRYKILLAKVEPIAKVREARTKKVRLRLRAEQLDDRRILALKHLVADHRGQCSMEMSVTVPGRYATQVVFGDEFKVKADDSLFVALERLFGGPVAELA
ncbi:DNA polymerase III, alpha subunit [Plesiocystis pacifica SIR-1]|uniref:DNA polymerase III subunit alpha n=1 Tax=Plesiocystis pacifica SIR-1 TaxID=391625 RepID=A6G5Y5_9BACT|nr:DNA polymerase III subunit alpha [Plesiocystis pacifica]EDM78759.1 DNA polymerase III, alpha subunit [Plesiocystis pacifica SIR-1]